MYSTRLELKAHSRQWFTPIDPTVIKAAGAISFCRRNFSAETGAVTETESEASVCPWTGQTEAKAVKISKMHLNTVSLECASEITRGESSDSVGSVRLKETWELVMI